MHCCHVSVLEISLVEQQHWHKYAAWPSLLCRMLKAFSIGLFWKYFSFLFYSEVIQRVGFLILTQVNFMAEAEDNGMRNIFWEKNRDADCAGYVSILHYLNREIYIDMMMAMPLQKILYFVVKETTFSVDEYWGNEGKMGIFSLSNVGWIVFLLAWIVWHIPNIYSSIWYGVASSISTKKPFLLSISLNIS